MEKLKAVYECENYVLDNTGIHLVNKELDKIVEKENMSFTRKQFCKAVLILARKSHQKDGHSYFFRKYWNECMLGEEVYGACCAYVGTRDHSLDRMNNTMISKQIAHRFNVPELLIDYDIKPTLDMGMKEVIECNCTNINSPIDFIREIVNIHWFNSSLELSNTEFMQSLYNVFENRLYQSELDANNEDGDIYPMLRFRSAKLDNTGIRFDNEVLNDLIDDSVGYFEDRQFVRSVCLLAEIENGEQYETFMEKYSTYETDSVRQCCLDYMKSKDYEIAIDKLLKESAESDSSCIDMAKVFRATGVKDSVEYIIPVLADESNCVVDCGIVVYRLIIELANNTNISLRRNSFMSDFYNTLKEAK